MIPMDMNQVLNGLGNSSGQFGLGGYNSPSGMTGGAPMGGGGGFGQALGMFGKMLGQHGNQQSGEPQRAPQQQDHSGFQRLLEQLMADQRPQSQGYGGRYANYLSPNL